MKDIDKKNPFSVPEGYFDGLTDQIMAQLPARHTETAVKRTMWQQMKPWTYMAAMFAGISLMINMFVKQPQPLDLRADADIEAFYQYYEDQVSNSIYHETVYVDETLEY
ncbi:MAG: hypothetical protein LBN93_08685 [Candidatus Symbiothrix sp.]|jgi:hypothetical protein|nr:hypothetical protein [Candidatus Symbiothrix sp.]